MIKNFSDVTDWKLVASGVQTSGRRTRRPGELTSPVCSVRIPVGTETDLGWQDVDCVSIEWTRYWEWIADSSADAKFSDGFKVAVSCSFFCFIAYIYSLKRNSS